MDSKFQIKENNMKGWLLGIYLFDELSMIRLFKLIKIGLLHTKNPDGIVKGIMFGIGRLEVQFTLGFWNRNIKEETIGHA